MSDLLFLRTKIPHNTTHPYTYRSIPCIYSCIYIYIYIYLLTIYIYIYTYYAYTPACSRHAATPIASLMPTHAAPS